MNQANPTTRNLCVSTRRDGQPCTVQALPGSDYCFAHDPARAAQRAEARRRGGLHRATAVRLGKLMPVRLTPIFGKLETALDDVQAGKITPQQATAMAHLARALVDVLRTGELEQVVRDLERQVEDSGYARQSG